MTDDGGEGGNAQSPSSKVAWGRYRDSPHSRRRILLDAPLFPGERRPGKMRVAVLVRAGYMRRASSLRLPPPVNWEMPRDFARVLADPEYVEWQVNDGLRPRADVQRAITSHGRRGSDTESDD